MDTFMPWEEMRHGCEVFITMLLSHDTFLPQASNPATHFLREEEVEGEVI